MHATSFVYRGGADPSVPGGIAAVYRELITDGERNQQILADVMDAISQSRHCLLLTQWTAHVELLAGHLREAGLDPIVLRGGMNTRDQRAAVARLGADSGQLLVVATGPYVGEGFDCPALDALFLAAPHRL